MRLPIHRRQIPNHKDQKYVYYEHGDKTPAGRSNSVTLIYGKIYDPGRREHVYGWRFLGSQRALTEETRRELCRKIHAGGALYEDYNEGRQIREEVAGEARDLIVQSLSYDEWRIMNGI